MGYTQYLGYDVLLCTGVFNNQILVYWIYGYNAHFKNPYALLLRFSLTEHRIIR
jgi:hypothetical protein